MAKLNNRHIRVGISGWTYAPWRKVFYPPDLPQKKELEYASRMLSSIEINGSFYSLQRPTTYAAWYDATPEDFVFSVKGGRYITHMLKLKNVESALSNFLASGLLALKEKLGPILWQLPPMFKFDAAKLESFFRLLPRDTFAVAEMAKGHDPKLAGRVLTTADAKRPLRYAMEVRHTSFQTPEFIDLLREHHIALVIADTAGRWPFAQDITADFVYVRLHGEEELYASGYTPEALDRWAAWLKLWQAGRQPRDAVLWGKQNPDKAASRDLFVYFDNDVKVKAPFDAMSLAERITPLSSKLPALAIPKLTKKAMAERVRSHWPATVKSKN